jgi:hypothetical protein
VLKAAEDLVEVIGVGKSACVSNLFERGLRFDEHRRTATSIDLEVTTVVGRGHPQEIPARAGQPLISL